ncbi:MAG TPA: hypothetical protein PKA16_10070 [Ottowia sp.]|nr:hypothetical protein [Ottowia sp.]HMN21726.1 hypothetical protein [Ottowia sp.]
MQTPTTALAERAVGARRSPISPDIVLRAKQSIADAMALGGRG